MGAMPGPAQSRLYAGLLPVELSVEAVAARATVPKDDQLQDRRPSVARRASGSVARFLIAFYIGVAATLAWQSYGDAARQFIAKLSPQLGWLALRAAGSHTDPLEGITHNVDQIVAASQQQMSRSVDQLAASQEQITRTVGQVLTNQEQIVREIIKLQAISQYGPYKSSEPSPRPARNAAQRTSQAR